MLVYREFMDESSAAQNRKSNRTPVMLSATLEGAGGMTQSVILRNLSSGGALVEGKWLPAQGSNVLFVRKDLRVRAQVAWVEGVYAGVMFERALDRAEILRQVPKPKEKFAPQFRRPGLACRPLTDADRRMVQMWATPVSVQPD